MFKGVGTALITPFTKDLKVDYDSWRKIIRYQLDGGVDAVIVLGTTGESPVIEEDERNKLVEIAVEVINGKIPVIVGTGSNSTNHVILLNKEAEKIGADGLLIVNPYYNKGTQESLIEHYRYIADKTSLPIILYNVPSRTSMNVLPETIIKIHEKSPNMIAVKEASGNISQISHLISIKPESLSVLSGNDDQTLPIMSLGGNGIVSVFSNSFPAELKKLTDALLQNRIDEARKLNNKFLKMMELLFIETSPAPIKYVMSRLGLCENVLRLPLAPLTQKGIESIEKGLEKYLLTVK